MNDRDLPDLRELAAVSASLERKPATAAIEWAAERFGDGLVLASSFQDCVLIDLAVQVAPDVDVVFLDTQYHFAETLWYVEAVRRRYDLNLRVVGPDIEPDDRWLDDPDGCCVARKVVPMAKALSGRTAWMTGLRRDEAATRAQAPIVGYDVGRGIVKVNPLATWTEADVARYADDRSLPEHPLRERGYASIGCWPCTRPVADGEDARAGRWAGLDKLECGLHA
ncbi:MAG TPA: phosphoadenylyl-sulfate reductase [Acidimicrobiia bacterium]|jgi:phosphoadenosine phosphosulfate reductase|nr:phosphoadenylyl-sulfate reductase [Acidimicrobiia bacterium]